MSAVVAAAEKLRIAGRLTEEVTQAIDGGQVIVPSETRTAAHNAANHLTVLWGAVAGVAGREYLDSLKAPKDQSFRMRHLIAEIQVAAASIDGAELVNAITDSGYAYRDVALLVVGIRARLGFATHAEVALLPASVVHLNLPEVPEA